MREIFLKKISDRYEDFLQFESLVKQKLEKVKNAKQDIKVDEIKDESSLQVVAKMYTDIYVDLVLFNRDKDIVFAKLMNEIDLFKELEKDGLPENIIEFYNSHKSYVATQMFIIKDDKVIEREDGMLQKNRDDFLANSPLIKELEKLNKIDE